MRWTKEQYAAYQARRSVSRAKPEQVVRHEPLAKTKGENGNSPRYAVRIVSYRRRLLDPDNLAGGSKYFLDGLRYAALIPGDRPDQITFEVRQVKVKTLLEERTEIKICNQNST